MIDGDTVGDVHVQFLVEVIQYIKYYLYHQVLRNIERELRVSNIKAFSPPIMSDACWSDGTSKKSGGKGKKGGK